jgi:DNA-binding GntR family transcriptional regulator
MTDTRKKKKPEKMDLAQKAYQGIRNMLFYNEIIPGQKIKYQDLADRIGVSITPVIHALKWLDFKNIVSHEPNCGYFVNEVSLSEIKEIYDTRLLLEVSLAPDSVRHLDDPWMKRMEGAFEAYQKAVREENYYTRLMTDMKFHLTLASISRCQVQLKILRDLFDMLLLKYTRNLILLGIMDSSLNEHVHIFNALAARDALGLQQALSDHLVHVRDAIIDGFKKMFQDRPDPATDPIRFP